MGKDCGIVSLESIEEMKMQREKQLYLQQHDKKIWQGENGKWYTYVSTKNGRKLLKKQDLAIFTSLLIE